MAGHSHVARSGPDIPAPVLVRLLINVGIVLVLAAFYLRFLRGP